MLEFGEDSKGLALFLAEEDFVKEEELIAEVDRRELEVEFKVSSFVDFDT